MSKDANSRIINTLKAAWINERFAPDLLPFNEGLVNSILDLISVQEHRINDARDTGKKIDEYVLNMMSLEMNRIQYILKSYLRARLAKIEKFFMHLLTDATSRGNLSQNEETYLKRYSDIVQSSLHSSALSQLPQPFQGLTDRRVDMVPRPNESVAVFVKVNQQIGEYQPENSDNILTLNKNDILIVFYGDVKGLIKAGRVSLC